MTVTHLLVGPRAHGVVRHGWDLHAQMAAQGFDVTRRWVRIPAELTAPPAGEAVHLQFTDKLFGSSPEDAASRFLALRAAFRGRVTATLHDIPQPSDGTGFSRRAAAFTAVAAACDGIVVSSDHEHELLRASGIHSPVVVVIPLPIPAPGPTHRCVPGGGRTVGVFGYIYPGKGHAEVITATAQFTGLDVVAIGAASQGHDDLVAELSRTARGRLRVTGFVADDRVGSALRRVTVPVVAHRHISASGSINSWLTAGRRPLAVANRYTAEFVRRNPGALTLYPDTANGLRTAIGCALHDPVSTWLAPGTVLTPSPPDVAGRHDAFFRLCA